MLHMKPEYTTILKKNTYLYDVNKNAKARNYFNLAFL
jgi:hypothetical protein